MRVTCSSRGLFLSAAMVLPASFFANSAFAQQAIEEVVVTAERRAEPIFDVPVSITAISGDQLKDLGYTDIKSVIAMVPNAVLADDSENFETYINIRGIHQADINAEPNFGLYRNGIFNGGQRGNIGAQIDVQRVEVLSGPQSGLYGRDAVGGVVNVVYATPDFDSVSGYAIANYGRYDNAGIQGAVNIPITENFAVRATGWLFDQEEGELYNPALDLYIDKKRDFGGRISAKWDATDQLSVLWMAELQDVHAPSLTAYAPDGISSVFGIPCCGFPFEPPETLHSINHDTPDREHWQQFYLSQDINYDTKTWAGTVELLAAYRNYHLRLTEDQDRTAFGPTSAPMVFALTQIRNESLNNFYGEVLWKSPQDQRFTWMAGADYFNENFSFERLFTGSVDFNLLNTEFAPGFTYANLACSFFMSPYDGGCEGNSTSPGLPGAGTGLFPYTVPDIGVQYNANAFGAPGSYLDTTSISGFVTGTYKLTDELSITAALRWDQTQKRLNYIQGPVDGYGSTPTSKAYLDPLFAQIIYPFTSTQSKKFVNVAPSVNIQYKLTDTANLYGVFATGFRSGGFNLGTSSPQYLPYGPEKAKNYEIGTKTLWFDNRLSVNADFFYMTQEKIVLPQTDTSEPAYLGLYYLSNVGNARTYGAELSAAYQATDWLNLATAIGWLDDKFTDGSTHGVSMVGQEIPLTRHWTINMFANVDYPINDVVSFVGDVNWRLEQGGWLSAAISTLQTTPYQPLNKLDIDVGAEMYNTRLSIYVNNMFNDQIAQFQYSNTTINVNQGRTYGLRIQYRF